MLWLSVFCFFWAWFPWLGSSHIVHTPMEACALGLPLLVCLFVTFMLETHFNINLCYVYVENILNFSLCNINIGNIFFLVSIIVTFILKIFVSISVIVTFILKLLFLNFSFCNIYVDNTFLNFSLSKIQVLNNIVNLSSYFIIADIKK